MRRIYSIVTTLLLFLTVSTGCEDDYRDMVLFEGVEPIYQIGTCTNLVSSLTLYLTDSEEVVLGIDGGDGEYSLSSDNTSVATVAFTEEVNGYRRIKVTPKAQGTANVLVTDHDGASTFLKVRVEDSCKLYLHVKQTGNRHTGELSEDFWKQIQVELADALTMKQGGDYVLVPADRENPWRGGGELLVHSSALVEGFMTGTYEALEIGGALAFRFCYNNEVHEFTLKDPIDTRTSPQAPLYMHEEVTSFVSAELPVGCRIYRVEAWDVYSASILYND